MLINICSTGKNGIEQILPNSHYFVHNFSGIRHWNHRCFEPQMYENHASDIWNLEQKQACFLKLLCWSIWAKIRCKRFYNIYTILWKLPISIWMPERLSWFFASKHRMKKKCLRGNEKFEKYSYKMTWFLLTTTQFMQLVFIRCFMLILIFW